MKRWILCLLPLLPVACSAPEDVNVVPWPAQVEVQRGWAPADAVPEVMVDESLAGRIGDEGYLLDVSRGGIRIQAAAPAGVFYARQTLDQLLGPKGYRAVHIEDVPRFAYRGFHVDVSRHFHSKDELLKIIDIAARYKFNNFHFHLVDNGGWRLQLDSYPLLTELGAYRVMKDWDGWWKLDRRSFCTADTPGAYGGYYTKDDIREIVAYAAERHINVIPEIEFPAHSDAVFVGYPELTCGRAPYSGGEFCPATPAVYDFIEAVLSEVMELFPSEVIHIGADEARKKEWRTCPACNAMMRREGMTSYDDLQCYMVSRIQAFLLANGRTMAGWDELLKNDDLDPSTYVFSYRGEKGGIRAANRGLRAVMTPGEILYCDWYQASPEYEKKAMYGYSPIRKMYAFDPVPDTPEKAAANECLVEARKVAPDSVEYILPDCRQGVAGIQICAWGEYIPDDDHLEYMLFPRLLAGAELAWSQPAACSWPRFRSELPAQCERLRALGVQVYDLHDAPYFSCRDGFLSIESENALAEVHYTLDGSEPTQESPRWTAPVPFRDSVEVRAAAFVDGRRVSYERCAVVGQDYEAYYPLTYYPQ